MTATCSSGPSARSDFWKQKITGTIERDKRNLAALKAAGWRVLIIWECALKGRTRLPLDEVLEEAARWLKSDDSDHEIRGNDNGNHGINRLDH